MQEHNLAAAPVWLDSLIGAIRSGALERDLHVVLPEQIRPKSDRHAAVLVTISGTPAATTLPRDAAVLLTHRSVTMRSHSGQIAFPGGRVDATDATYTHTALREAEEEVGLVANKITPLAELEPLLVQATGYPVTPVLAYAPNRPEVYQASPEEVDEVFYCNVHDLIDPARRFVVRREAWSGPAFHIRDYLIWGFTARILDGIIRHAGWEQPWDTTTHYDLAESIARSRNNHRHEDKG